LEEASHLAARKLGLDDKSYLDDPIFRNIERASNPDKKTRWSVDHDKIVLQQALILVQYFGEAGFSLFPNIQI